MMVSVKWQKQLGKGLPIEQIQRNKCAQFIHVIATRTKSRYATISNGRYARIAYLGAWRSEWQL